MAQACLLCKILCELKCFLVVTWLDLVMEVVRLFTLLIIWIWRWLSYITYFNISLWVSFFSLIMTSMAVILSFTRLGACLRYCVLCMNPQQCLLRRRQWRCDLKQLLYISYCSSFDSLLVDRTSDFLFVQALRQLRQIAQEASQSSAANWGQRPVALRALSQRLSRYFVLLLSQHACVMSACSDLFVVAEVLMRLSMVLLMRVGH